MIIVSQRRKKIINFDKSKMIEVIYVEIDETIPAIDELRKFYEIEDNEENSLGIYKTEERAKEVLREIIDTYKFNHCDAVGQKQAVYRMPEE